MVPATRKVSVLVIDDDAANLRVFVRAFRKVYEVVVATSGTEALAILATRASASPIDGRDSLSAGSAGEGRHGAVDVAFVDLQMPGMNGIEVLRELARAHPTIVRYMLTGNSDAELLDPVKASGLCVRVLGKPWARVEIEQAIADAMATRPAPT